MIKTKSIIQSFYSHFREKKIQPISSPVPVKNVVSTYSVEKTK
jgi:hypothetical protein